MGDLRGSKMMFALCVLCCLGLTDIIGQSCPIPQIFLLLLKHLFLVCLTLGMFRGDTEKKILAASMLISALALGGNFFVSLFSCLVLFWKHTVKNIAVPFVSDRESSLIVCVSLVAVLWMINRIAKHAAPVFSSCANGCSRTKKWYLTLAVPLFAITAVVDVASWGASKGILVRSGGNMSLYYDQIFSNIEFCVLTALSMFGAGFYVFGMNRIYLEQQKSGQYYAQVAAYRMLEEQYSRLERLRHDLKNHMTALSGLLEKKEWEKMTAYLKKMNDSSGISEEEEVTGNRVVDVILRQKRKWAESKNILWECDVQMPGKCCISEFDLCVLFGNILDNAVEACERMQDEQTGSVSGSVCRKFINIQAKAVKKCFLMEVKNSTDLKAAGNARATYGIGLLNVRDVVLSYHGVMNTEVREGIFVITVLIPQSEAAHDMKQTV